MAHFLLQNKLLKSYKKTLQMLKDQCKSLGFDLKQKLSSGSIMMDFEWAMMKAIKIHFKNCIIKGCRFHLGQSWWRKIKELGLEMKMEQISSNLPLAEQNKLLQDQLNEIEQRESEMMAKYR